MEWVPGGVHCVGTGALGKLGNGERDTPCAVPKSSLTDNGPQETCDCVRYNNRDILLERLPLSTLPLFLPHSLIHKLTHTFAHTHTYTHLF